MMLRTAIPALAFACLAAAHAPPARAALADSNPFLPPGYGDEEAEKQKPKKEQPKPERASRNLELRGLVEIDGEHWASIFDKQKKTSYWLKSGQSEEGLSVRQVNPDDRSLIVSYRGRTEQLRLNQSDNAPLPVKTTAKNGSNGGDSSSENKSSNKSSNKSGKTDSGNAPRRRRVVLPNRD